MTRLRISFWLVVGLLITTSGATQAGLILVSQPTASYLSSTTLIPITAGDFTDVTSLGDANLTIAFSDTMNARSVPVGGWATWGSPPETEGSTPRVLTSNLEPNPTSRTLTFSQSLSIFGLEAEPQQFAVHNITLDFFNGDDLVGSISRNPNGNAGALLFAALATDNDVFTRVVLTTADPTGFATAHYRYALAPAQTVPEPSTLALAAAGLLGFGCIRLRRRTVVR